MSFVAAAVIGAGVVGAGASIYGANKAADAQTNAANSSIAAQQQMFGVAKDELQPFADFGKAGMPAVTAWNDSSNPNSPLNKLLALTMGNGTDMNAALESTPGYQSSKDQGMKAVTSGLAARGLAGPGGALAKGGANYAEGLAGTTWQSVVNALTNTYGAGAANLQGIVNTGANAAGNLAGGSIQTGQGISNSLIGAGNAQAGAAIGSANAIGSGANSVSSGLLLNKLLGGSSGGIYGTSPGNIGGTGLEGFGGVY